MFFRRELDFDELIETIDQLADEEIDEVVDWQLTASPAAKQERTSTDGARTRLGLGPNWTSRFGETAAAAMNELLSSANPAPPAQRGWTIQDLIALRNEAWRTGNRNAALGIERQIQEQSRPLRRTEMQQRGELVFAPDVPLPLLGNADANQDGMRLQVNYRRVSYAVETLVDPIRDRLKVRMKWSETGAVEAQYQESAVSLETLRVLSAPVPLLRAAVDAERSIIVELDPRRASNVAVFMEGP